jgi:hypothetical protein
MVFHSIDQVGRTSGKGITKDVVVMVTRPGRRDQRRRNAANASFASFRATIRCAQGAQAALVPAIW